MKPKFIELTCDGIQPFTVNAEHISIIWPSSTEDITVIWLNNGDTYRVSETVEQIMQKIGE